MNNDSDQTLQARIRALSSPLDPRPTAEHPVIDELPGIRAVLFDIYGTLVISASGDIGLAGERDEDSSFRAALESAGIEAPPGTGPAALEDAIRAFHAQRRSGGVEFPEVDILDMWRAVLGGQRNLATEPPLAGREAGNGDSEGAGYAEPGQRPGTPFTGETTPKGSGVSIARLAVEYECRVNPVWPMPGLKQVLAEIAGRDLALGIVSNAQFYTPLMLEAFLGRSLADLGFDPACCTFSYRLLEAKPSTRIYEQALAGLADARGIAPGEVLYIGNDLRNDIWPATRVGCRTALFAGDERSLRLRGDDPRCAHLVPDRVVTDLRQITASILPP